MPSILVGRLNLDLSIALYGCHVSFVRVSETPVTDRYKSLQTYDSLIHGDTGCIVQRSAREWVGLGQDAHLTTDW